MAVRALIAMDDPTTEVRAHHNNSSTQQQLGTTSWRSARLGLISLGAQDLRPDDPFLRWHSAAKCAQQAHRPPAPHVLITRARSILSIEQVYIGPNESATVRGASPGVRGALRKCKLAVLCAMIHVEEEPYARCIQGDVAM